MQLGNHHCCEIQQRWLPTRRHFTRPLLYCLSVNGINKSSRITKCLWGSTAYVRIAFKFSRIGKAVKQPVADVTRNYKHGIRYSR